MQVNIQASAKKDLKKISKVEINRIIQATKNLTNYPEISNIKKLVNHNPPYRLRVGNYRILFDIEDDEIIIVNIKHRKEAY